MASVMQILLVDKRTAAEALSVSIRSVERMIAEKSLPAVRVRGSVRIPVTALLSLVSEQEPLPLFERDPAVALCNS